MSSKFDWLWVITMIVLIVACLGVGMTSKPATVQASAPDVKFPYTLDESVMVHCDKNTDNIIYEIRGPNHGSIAIVQRNDICHP